MYLSNSSDPECDINATIEPQWIYKYMGECVVELKQYFALIIGLISIVFWILSQWPQIVVNCKTGRSDENISIWCLLFWTLGDIASFLGTILANQLFTQIILAAYFVLVDFVCLIQFIVHFVNNHGGLPSLRLRCVKRNGYRNLYVVTLVLLLSGVVTFLPIRNGTDHKVKWRTRNLLEVTQAPPIIDTQNREFLIGYILGWIYAFINFFALPFQIIKNLRRCSVSGLSMLMFVLFILGDTTYLLGILLFSIERIFIIQSLPWIIQSVCDIFFSMVIILQILVYRCICCRPMEQLEDNSV